MSKHTVVDLAGRDTPEDPLTELLRSGARQLIQQAVESELQELLGEYAQRRTEDGRAGVVRNGYRRITYRTRQFGYLLSCATVVAQVRSESRQANSTPPA